MSQISSRLLAKFLWLRERFTTLTARPMGRVGVIFVVAFLAIFVVANPAHAGIDTAIDFMTKIMYWVASLITKLIVLFLDAVIQIMLYNSFSNNPVVSAGWAIVRDVVNMFFVVILIVIAFGTIFGHSRFQWQQQVPKLMIFALVINFSKTLCGIMIDFAQVIMLTFANALREVAAGNFLQLLGLSDMWKINPESPGLTGGDTGNTLANSFNQFAAAGASIFMVLAVLGTTIILAVILLYRVIMLWVMIVLAPLAWFIGGASGQGGLINSNAYASWWDKFKCLVMIGPVLTFFLWLTLAVAGAGATATSTGFNVTDSSNAGFVGAIFSMDKFMSFLIGLAMIYAGFDAAQQICQSMSGSFLGKQLKGGPSGGMAGAAGGLALKSTAWTARKAGAGLRAFPGKMPGGARLQSALQQSKYAPLRALTKTGRADMYQTLSGKMGKGFVGRAAGVVASRAAASARKDKTEAIKKAGERFKGDTRSTKVDLLERVAAAGGTTSARGKAEVMHLLTEAAGDKTMQKQLRASGAMGKLLGKYGDELSSNFADDTGMTDKINKMKLENADVTGMGGKIDNWDQVKSQNAAFFANPKNSELLDSIDTEHYDPQKKRTLTAREAVEQGLAGKQAKRAMREGMSAVYDTMSVGELNRVGAQELAEQGSASNHEKAVMTAMENGDIGRARELITMLAQALSNSDLGAEQRFEAASSLDNIGVGLLDMKIADGATARQVDQVDSVFAHYTDKTDAASIEAAKLGKPHGEPPPIEERVEDTDSPVTDDNIPTIAAGQFGNASTERIVDAIKQLGDRKKDKQGAIQRMIADPDGKMNAELDELRSTNQQLITQIQRDIQERKKPQRQAAVKDIEDEMSSVDAEIAALTAQIQALDRASGGPGGHIAATEAANLRSTRGGLQDRRNQLESQKSQIEARINVEMKTEIAQEIQNNTDLSDLRAQIDAKIQEIKSAGEGKGISDIAAKELREQAEKLDRHIATIDKYISAIQDVQSGQK